MNGEILCKLIHNVSYSPTRPVSITGHTVWSAVFSVVAVPAGRQQRPTKITYSCYWRSWSKTEKFVRICQCRNVKCFKRPQRTRCSRAIVAAEQVVLSVSSSSRGTCPCHLALRSRLRSWTKLFGLSGISAWDSPWEQAVPSPNFHNRLPLTQLSVLLFCLFVDQIFPDLNQTCVNINLNICGRSSYIGLCVDTALNIITLKKFGLNGKKLW